MGMGFLVAKRLLYTSFFSVAGYQTVELCTIVELTTTLGWFVLMLLHKWHHTFHCFCLTLWSAIIFLTLLERWIIIIKFFKRMNLDHVNHRWRIIIFMILYEISKQKGIRCKEKKGTPPSIPDHTRDTGKENTFNYYTLLWRQVKPE